MTPQERQLIDDLFGRLAGLENAHRDPDAERAIIEGLRRAPNATYALVQTVLLQDEALKRANAHIEELEAEADAHPHDAPQSGSFLDSMRDAVFGSSGSRGSVPNVRPNDPGASRPVWNSGGALNAGAGDPRMAGYAQGGPGYGAPGYGGPGYGGPGYGAPMGGGSSFLGTAAAAAVGTIGGSMLMNGIRGLMGGHQAFADSSVLGGGSSSPWSRSDLSNSDLAREAGVNDISASRDRGAEQNQNQSLFDNSSNDNDNGSFDNASTDNDDDGFDSDDFGGGGDDSDFA